MKEHRIVMSIDPNQPIKKYLLQLQRKLEVDIRKYTLWQTSDGVRPDLDKGPMMQDRTWAMYGFEKGSIVYVREAREDDPKPDPNAPSIDELKQQMEEKRKADEKAKEEAAEKAKEEAERKAKEAAEKKLEEAAAKKAKEEEAKKKKEEEEKAAQQAASAPSASPFVPAAVEEKPPASPTQLPVAQQPPMEEQAAAPPTANQPPPPQDAGVPYSPQPPTPPQAHAGYYSPHAIHSPPSNWAQTHGLVGPPSSAVEALERQVAELQREIRVLKHVNTQSTSNPIEDIPDDDVRAAAAAHLLSLQESILRRRQSANAAVRLYEETHWRGKSTERRLHLL